MGSRQLKDKGFKLYHYPDSRQLARHSRNGSRRCRPRLELGRSDCLTRHVVRLLHHDEGAPTSIALPFDCGNHRLGSRQVRGRRDSPADLVYLLFKDRTKAHAISTGNFTSVPAVIRFLAPLTCGSGQTVPLPESR